MPHLPFAILQQHENVFILFSQNQLGDGAWTAPAVDAVNVTVTEMEMEMEAEVETEMEKLQLKHVHTNILFWHVACGMWH